MAFDVVEEPAPPKPTATAQVRRCEADGAVVLLLGGPGSGRHTQCEMLADQYACPHVSQMELLRSAVSSSAPQGKQVVEAIRAGHVLSGALSLSLLTGALQQGAGMYFVQGWPRSEAQFDAFVERCGPCAAVLYLEAPHEALQRRLAQRHATASATDAQAARDTPEAVERRLKGFEVQEMELVRTLQQRGTVSVLDGARPPKEVFADVCAVVDNALKQWGV